jgi:holo-[acyl-carrier protein] synthase
MNLGVDLCHIPRVEQLIRRRPGFTRRFFTEKEQVLFDKPNPAQTVAAHFALKEAFAKALGTGVVGFDLNEVEVLRNSAGAPLILVHGRAKARLDEQGYCEIVCSMSHDKDYAIGMVILK